MDKLPALDKAKQMTSEEFVQEKLFHQRQLARMQELDQKLDVQAKVIARMSRELMDANETITLLIGRIDKASEEFVKLKKSIK